MAYYYISTYTPYAILFVLFIFSSIKLYKLSQSHLKEIPLLLFFSSFGIYSPQTIRNTFHNGLKNYYKASNNMNYILYVLLAILTGAYIFISLSGGTIINP